MTMKILVIAGLQFTYPYKRDIPFFLGNSITYEFLKYQNTMTYFNNEVVGS
jgi:hypothetical protein